MTLGRLKLYFNTLRYLKPIQIYYRLYYKVFTPSLKSFSQELDVSKLEMIPSIVSYPSLQNCEFSFLNLSKDFVSRIDWNFPDYGKLWTYNLNYFEFLNQPSLSIDEGLFLILDFIKNIDVIKDGLEPFPTSLRIMNWIKFIIQNKIEDEKIINSLYAQFRLLEKKIEFHLLGNHLLENYFALVSASIFFKDKIRFNKYVYKLENQLDEQILQDGGHFELSPMYHQLMLFRAMDTYNFMLQSKFGLRQKLKDKIEIMLGWLVQISFDNGVIPLFNDSANRIAPSSHELLSYAKRLQVKAMAVPLSNSGYRKMKSSHMEIMIDVGCLGPDYILAHAHNDTFNFVMQINNQPFLVDSGVSTYEANTRRSIERSTVSHNTVQIGQFEQSEIWSSFRVARRAKPKLLVDEENQLEAELKYATINEKHKRAFSLWDDKFIIVDTVYSDTMSNAFFHFESGLSLNIINNTVYSSLGRIDFDGAIGIVFKPFSQALEFNQLKEGVKVEVSFRQKLVTTIQPS